MAWQVAVLSILVIRVDPLSVNHQQHARTILKASVASERPNLEDRRPPQNRYPRRQGGGPVFQLRNPQILVRKADTVRAPAQTMTRQRIDVEKRIIDAPVLPPPTPPSQEEGSVPSQEGSSVPAEPPRTDRNFRSTDKKAKKTYQERRKDRERPVETFRGAKWSLKKKKNRVVDRPPKEKKPGPPPIIVHDGATMPVSELAAKLERSGVEIVKHMMLKLGVLASVTQSVDAATARQVIEDFGRTWVADDETGAEDDEAPNQEFFAVTGVTEDDDASLAPRAPVVTIMGHVDHGKTSLLDAMRSTSVAAGETGGITQGIGAYKVKVHDDKSVTFLDTPGHAAFSEMRERGANCTDVVVLVVAADDGVKAQTVDSIACAKAARVPIVVAVNKMDVPEADPSKVENELMAYDLVPEEYGGETMYARVSAKTKDGLDDLLEKLLLQAEILDLKANFNESARASGVVVEAHVEKGLGVVATTLVRRGKLKVGDPFAAGVGFGRVRALFDDNGNSIDSALPSSPVQVVGWQSDTSRIPSAGDAFVVAFDEQSARKVADAREAIASEKKAAKRRGISAKSFADFQQLRTISGRLEQREVTVLIKADTAGAVEAMESGLAALDVQDEVSEVKANVVYSGVGDVTKSDVAVAAVSGALILAFNVGATKDAQDDVKALLNSPRQVDLHYYGVIYDALNEVERRMNIVLSPTPDGELVGSATIKALFDIGKLGKVAGCAVTNGYLRRGAKFRVMNGDRIKLPDGKIRTLRNVKVDVDRIESGNDCGLSFVDWDDFDVGDVIECYDATT